MADIGDLQNVSRHLTYSKSNVPLFGALLDYLETSLEYLRQKTFARGERLHLKATRASLSATFVSTVCLLLGLVCNVKFEVMTFEDEPLPKDLHFMLMSIEDKLYIDDIDVSSILYFDGIIAEPILLWHISVISQQNRSGVVVCVEASDVLVILFSTLLIWNSSYVRSPLSEYLYLPWLGAALRGLFLRQTPTAGALIYTMAVINGNVNPLFLTAFTFLFLLEARLWLEIARLVRMRWERRNHLDVSHHSYEVQTLWSNDDVQSVEVGNYVY